MKKVKYNVVIGKNFGDEGKGMAVDMLSTDAGRTVVIRHNGGSQSGHTVEKDDIRLCFMHWVPVRYAVRIHFGQIHFTQTYISWERSVLPFWH